MRSAKLGHGMNSNFMVWPDSASKSLDNSTKAFAGSHAAQHSVNSSAAAELIAMVETESAAIANAVRRATETVEHLDWFEVAQTRGHILDGAVDYFQVHLKLGFKLNALS